MKILTRIALAGALAALVLAGVSPASANTILVDANNDHIHVTALPGQPGSLDISRHYCASFVRDPDGDGNFGNEGAGYSSPSDGFTASSYPPAATFTYPFGPGGGITPTPNDTTAGDEIDHHWLHDDRRPPVFDTSAADYDAADNLQPVPPYDPLVFDFGDGSTQDSGPTDVVDYFPVVDHPNLENDPFAVTVYGMTSPTADPSTWQKGDLITVFDEGWDRANPDTYVDDFVQRWKFAQPFQYFALQATPGVFPDAEVDALCVAERLTTPQPPPGRGQIAPTATTCQDFAGGTADNLDAILYSTRSGKISNVSPGVFFYYSQITAPDTSVDVVVDQKITSGNFSTLFSAQNIKNVRVFDANCNVVPFTLVHINGTVELTFNATAGATYYVSVKYTSTTVVGAAQPSPPTVDYSFTTTVDGVGPMGVDTLQLVKK